YVIVVSLVVNKFDFDRSITLSVAAEAVNGTAIITVISKTPDNKIDNAFFIAFISFVTIYLPILLGYPSLQAPQGVQQSVSPFSSLRSRVNGCGNPFFLFRVLRILSRSALRMTDIQLLQAPQGVQIYFRLNKILPFIIALSSILP
ncbi:MAG TPA: hypothetical protein DCY23_02710, partial [Ruminococcaceae bacterium]|nr:hypothetical protein [Oscillospiraceae bacterium]